MTSGNTSITSSETGATAAGKTEATADRLWGLWLLWRSAVWGVVGDRL